MFKRKQFDPKSFGGEIIKSSCCTNFNTLKLALC